MMTLIIVGAIVGTFALTFLSFKAGRKIGTRSGRWIQRATDAHLIWRDHKSLGEALVAMKNTSMATQDPPDLWNMKS